MTLLSCARPLDRLSGLLCSIYDTLNDGGLRRKLESRGKKYYNMIKTKFAHKQYYGQTLNSKPIEVGL